MAVNECSGEELQIKLCRKYLKIKIQEDDVKFVHGDEHRGHLLGLLKRTVEAGESNSALIVGARGSGKTTLVNSVLHELQQKRCFREDSIVVRLNGLIHTDDKTALNSITTQMCLDNTVGDRVFGSFAENLAFLLSCLKSGEDKGCKSVLFFLDEFDMFCHVHGSQTLLYNLFDIAQSRQAPICVIGMTCRLDVVELLEKRVKSRFSHRQIFLFPRSHNGEDNPFHDRMMLFCELLSLPSDITETDIDKNKRRTRFNSTSSANSENSDKISTPKKREKITKINNKKQDLCEDFNEVLNQYEVSHDVLVKCGSSWHEFKDLDPIFVSFWNESIEVISEDVKVRNVLESLYNINVSERIFRDILFRLVCKLSSHHPQLEPIDVIQVCESALGVDDKINMLLSLSVLELSLIITMKHHSEIFDNQPVNFEIVFNRYSKFVNSNSSSQSVPRAVVLKAFEHLRSLELISPCRGEGGANSQQLQKEYIMFRLNVTPSQIMNAVNTYKAIPTELAQWASSSLI